jgi:hypothetical protein
MDRSENYACKTNTVKWYLEYQVNILFNHQIIKLFCYCEKMLKFKCDLVVN